MRVRRWGVAAVLTVSALVTGGCGYDTNNQNSPNSTQVGTETDTESSAP